jgi:preprotein translocase subunit SecG
LRKKKPFQAVNCQQEKNFTKMRIQRFLRKLTAFRAFILLLLGILLYHSVFKTKSHTERLQAKAPPLKTDDSQAIVTKGSMLNNVNNPVLKQDARIVKGCLDLN